jgi:hypothetical protein
MDLPAASEHLPAAGAYLPKLSRNLEITIHFLSLPAHKVEMSAEVLSLHRDEVALKPETISRTPSDLPKLPDFLPTKEMELSMAMHNVEKTRVNVEMTSVNVEMAINKMSEPARIVEWAESKVSCFKKKVQGQGSTLPKPGAETPKAAQEVETDGAPLFLSKNEVFLGANEKKYQRSYEFLVMSFKFCARLKFISNSPK